MGWQDRIKEPSCVLKIVDLVSSFMNDQRQIIEMLSNFQVSLTLIFFLVVVTVFLMCENWVATGIEVAMGLFRGALYPTVLFWLVALHTGQAEVFQSHCEGPLTIRMEVKASQRPYLWDKIWKTKVK